MTFCLVAGASAVRLAAAPFAASADGKKAEEANSQGHGAKGETLVYSGRLTDKDTGLPIGGATVTVRRSLLGDPERDEINPVLAETKHTTRADGKYSFTIPPEESTQRYLYIELDVEHPGYGSRKGAARGGECLPLWCSVPHRAPRPAKSRPAPGGGDAGGGDAPPRGAANRGAGLASAAGP
jgi:hypothetical protein